jgi:hypothetical protein
VGKERSAEVKITAEVPSFDFRQWQFSWCARISYRTRPHQLRAEQSVTVTARRHCQRQEKSPVPRLLGLLCPKRCVMEAKTVL